MGFIIATLAVQLASAYFNCTRGNKQASEISKKQHELEEKILRDGIENCRQEFLMLSSLQRELEYQTQQDRLNLIRSNHTKNIINNAYSQSLSTWPLLIPPYVLKRDSLLGNSQVPSNYMLPLNCIITTSMNSKFNSRVFTKFEERVAEFCSHNWSHASKKGICFLQNAWRDTITDAGSKIYDLYAHLADVPTLVLYPIIKEDGKLIFRFYWWGISNDGVQHIDDSGNEYDPCLNIRFNADFDYNPPLVEQIIDELSNKISAFISYFADLYYWNFYGYKFTLPTLLARGMLKIDTEAAAEYCEEYQKMLIGYVDKYPKVQLDSNLLAHSIQEIQTITKVSPVKEILTSLMSKEDFMLSSDVRLIENLEDCLDTTDNDVSVQVSQFKKQLIAKETIITIPCSNTDELFKHIQNLAYFENVNTARCYLRIITKEAFIACIASGNKVYYSHPNARYTLFILDHELEYSKYLSCFININTKDIFSVEKQLNPCYTLSVDKTVISKVIIKNKEYLKQLQNTYNNIQEVVEDVLNRTDQNIHIEESLSLSDINNWAKDKYINGDEYNLVLGYDKHKKIYVYLGCYLNHSEILDNQQYLRFSKLIHPTLLKAMNRKCIYSIKFINYEKN